MGYSIIGFHKLDQIRLNGSSSNVAVKLLQLELVIVLASTEQSLPNPTLTAYFSVAIELGR